MAGLKLTKAGFKTYLEANPRKKFTPRGGCSCPIAKYLSSQRKDVLVVVRSDYYLDYTQPNKTERKLPAWTKKFIAAFDATVPTFEPDVGKTGAFALKVFNTCE